MQGRTVASFALPAAGSFASWVMLVLHSVAASWELHVSIYSTLLLGWFRVQQRVFAGGVCELNWAALQGISSTPRLCTNFDCLGVHKPRVCVSAAGCIFCWTQRACWLRHTGGRSHFIACCCMREAEPHGQVCGERHVARDNDDERDAERPPVPFVFLTRDSVCCRLCCRSL